MTTQPPPERPLDPRGRRGTLVDDLVPLTQKSRTARVGLWLAGLLVVAGTAGALVFLLVQRPPGLVGPLLEDAVMEAHRDRADAPPAVAPSTSVTMITPTGEAIPGLVWIDSKPVGAKVVVDGVELGTTPLVTQHAFTADTALVELSRAGHATWRRRVPVESGGLRVEATLSRAK